MKTGNGNTFPRIFICGAAKGRQAVNIKKLTFLKSDERGFTLLEIILSIAVLSLVSIFILEMFMTAANLNIRAKNADSALTKVITEIDRIKGAAVTAADINEGTAVNYYDKYWLPLPGFNEKACFIMELVITRDGNNSDIYTVTASVWDLKDGAKSVSLAEISAKKYVAGTGGNVQ